MGFDATFVVRVAENVPDLSEDGQRPILSSQERLLAPKACPVS